MTNETYTCSKCGTKGHTARSRKCPFGVGGKKGKPVTRKSPKAAASRNGFGGALAALRIERGELDQAIAALERLEARGR